MKKSYFSYLITPLGEYTNKRGKGFDFRAFGQRK